MNLDFGPASNVNITVGRGETWSNVWTFVGAEAPLVGTFTFVVTRADGTEVSATCTIVDATAKTVSIALSATQTDIPTDMYCTHRCTQTVGSVVVHWFQGRFQTT